MSSNEISSSGEARGRVPSFAYPLSVSPPMGEPVLRRYLDLQREPECRGNSSPVRRARSSSRWSALGVLPEEFKVRRGKLVANELVPKTPSALLEDPRPERDVSASVGERRTTRASSRLDSSRPSSDANARNWAIVLAAGDGTRLRDLTTRGGVATPKQYCSLRGGRSLLGDALARAARVVTKKRILVVVA